MALKRGRIGLVLLGCLVVLIGFGGYALAAGAKPAGGQDVARGRVPESVVGWRLEQAPEAISSTLYLPVVAKGVFVCADFNDDFSDPGSGWDIVDDEYERTEYLNGEYRVVNKVEGYIYYYPAPTCQREDYEVEVDARWATTPAQSYGILFGFRAETGYNIYYIFDVNTDYQQYRLFRRDPAGWTTLQPPADSLAIHAGTASNHLKVTRQGASITLAANGTVLGTWSDSAITGLTSVGVMSSPYDGGAFSDARFDNFAVRTLASPGSAAGSSDGGVPPAGRGMEIALETDHW